MNVEPVQTQAGETMRQRAIAILTARHEWLSERKGKWDFSPIEAQHLAAVERELRGLAALAPDGPLLPSRGGLSFTQ